jgi:hypothetical protein
VAQVPAQVPVLAVVEVGLRWLAVLLALDSAAALLEQVALLGQAAALLAQPMAVLVAELAALEEAEALVDLLSRQSFSAAMARSTT